MGPSRHLWFLHTKQRPLDKNYKSLWVVDLTWRFVHAKQRLWTRITSLYEFKLSYVFLCIENGDFRTKIACLYGYQTSPVILFMQNRVPSIRITSSYGSQTSPVIFCMQNSVPNIRITSLYGSQPSSGFLLAKQRLLDQTYKSLRVPDLTFRFVHAKQRA